MCVDQRQFVCKECGDCTLCIDEYYMVRDIVWTRAGLKVGMLCVGCLEAKIGRELVPADFPSYPVNGAWYPKSDRLAKRQGFVKEGA